MPIKLRFDRHDVYPARRVWTERADLQPVAGMLDSDLQTPESARRSAQRMREVIAGTREPFSGSGNGYFTSVEREETEVGLDDRDDPITISVSTVALIAAIEEWAAHLEHKLKTTGSYF